jgi:hypothetical protein
MSIITSSTQNFGKFGAVLAIIGMAAGCSSDAGSDADVGAVQEGLVISEADANAGRLAGSFVREGRVIYFEAERGEENPSETATDPDVPRFAVDVRFLDAAGRTLILSGGGGEVARPDWAPEGDQGDPEERTKDLELVAQLGGELELLGPLPGLEYELDKVAQLAEELRGFELVVKPEGGAVCLHQRLRARHDDTLQGRLRSAGRSPHRGASRQLVPDHRLLVDLPGLPRVVQSRHVCHRREHVGLVRVAEPDSVLPVARISGLFGVR